jgi:hypothetical protein
MAALLFHVTKCPCA